MSLDITPAEAQLASPNQPPAITPLPRRTLWLMAAACGICAANIYYNQPLLEAFARYFHATEKQAGLVATASQVGYGVGMFFFVPLGDLYERRRIVLALVYACIALLVVTAYSPNLITLIVMHLLVGATAMSAQILIPLAVDLSPPERRGHTVGTLMGGLLVGILLARTLSGFVGDHYGWRAMFFLAAGMMVVLAIALQVGLPHRRPTLSMSYAALMRSIVALLPNRALWAASITSALSFAGFMAFWTALSFLMADRFHRGASEAGLFGVIGVVGVLAAPLAGKLSDRRGPAFTVTIALLSSVAAFALMWSWVTIAGLIVGVLLMDLGVQSIQVAAQATVMSLNPEARSRINMLYMVTRFIGAACGSAIGASAWYYAGWPGVCAACIAMLVVAMVVHLIGTVTARRAPVGAR